MIDYDLLDAVNFQVNRLIKFTPDGVRDKWSKAAETEATKIGDCEDYAIVKAHRLVKWNRCNPSDLSIGKFRPTRKGGQNHAMLLAKGQKRKGLFRKSIVDCVYVLDNRTNNIYTLDQIRDSLIETYPVDDYI